MVGAWVVGVRRGGGVVDFEGEFGGGVFGKGEVEALLGGDLGCVVDVEEEVEEAAGRREG